MSLNSTLALYTTVFPNALPYVSEFFRSVAAQTDRGFTLWVGLDRLSVAEVSPHLSHELDDVRWVPAVGDDTFASVRGRAWAEIVERHPATVFADSDDVLVEDRVTSARQSLRRVHVDACAMTLIDHHGDSLGELNVAGQESFDSLLARTNVFGLSNSAYRSDALANVLPLGTGTNIIDWHIASRAHASGFVMGVRDEKQMLYRQYGANMARVLPPFPASYLREAANLVLRHYDSLKPYVLGSDLQGRIERRRSEVERFSNLPEARLATYSQALDEIASSGLGWWECIAHPDLEDLW